MTQSYTNTGVAISPERTTNTTSERVRSKPGNKVTKPISDGKALDSLLAKYRKHGEDLVNKALEGKRPCYVEFLDNREASDKELAKEVSKEISSNPKTNLSKRDAENYQPNENDIEHSVNSYNSKRARKIYQDGLEEEAKDIIYARTPLKPMFNVNIGLLEPHLQEFAAGAYNKAKLSNLAREREVLSTKLALSPILEKGKKRFKKSLNAVKKLKKRIKFKKTINNLKAVRAENKKAAEQDKTDTQLILRPDIQQERVKLAEKRPAA